MSMSQMTIDGMHKFCIKEIGSEVSSLGLFEVLFTPSDVTLSCSCKRFERYGLLCQHSFYALRICGVSEFPKRYVSRRWTRDAVTREKRIVFDGRNKFSDESIRDEIVKDIIGSVEYCIDKLALNIEELAKFRDRIQDIKSKVDTDLPNQRSMSDLEVISSALGVSKPSRVKLCNPLKSKNKAESLAIFFNWFLFSVTTGAIFGVTFVVWISANKGWDWGFSICTVAVLVSALFLLMGKSMYQNYVPKGSPISRILQDHLIQMNSHSNQEQSYNSDIALNPSIPEYDQVSLCSEGSQDLSRSLTRKISTVADITRALQQPAGCADSFLAPYHL
ncbi:NRT1/ PTR family 4.5-like protein [Tanacetum coccineum]